jgi:hypothetical protein
MEPRAFGELLFCLTPLFTVFFIVIQAEQWGIPFLVVQQVAPTLYAKIGAQIPCCLLRLCNVFF